MFTDLNKLSKIYVYKCEFIIVYICGLSNYSMTVALLNQFHKTFKEPSLFHRYIALKHIAPVLKKHEDYFDVKIIGQSVLGQPIHVITLGRGKRKVFMWSQMHGNESTTTKAIFDLCNLFAESDHVNIQKILNSCTVAVIPMLNPDGAEVYTRLNANDVDLNRDAQDLSQPESRVLRTFFDDFEPDFCFNLHGQRTIFSAGNSNLPATVSFLAPAQDETCMVTDNRKKAMEILTVMNANLQQQIPGQVGVYDDAFNMNCVGDTFQSKNIPTVLFEAGHYTNDYAREETRCYMFQSILTALHYIATTEITGDKYKAYFDIPQNKKLFYDIIIRNASLDGKVSDIGILYKEQLIKDEVEFIPTVEKIANLNGFYGHKEFDANKNNVSHKELKPIIEGDEIDLVLIKNQKIALNLQNI